LSSFLTVLPQAMSDWSSPNETTILVVAEHAIIRAGLRAVLEATPGFSVVGDVSDTDAAIVVAVRLAPDVVLLGSTPADPAEMARMSALRQALPSACVMCLANKAVLGFDAALCLPPDAGVAELCSTLGSALGDRCAACLLRPRCPAPAVAVALSRREKQVAVCVAEGMSSKRIAVTLGIAPRTVNTYRESLARKLGASSAAVVTRYVLQHKLTAQD
jgi:DNA-binding NarL/FixJ family response regulator